MKELQTICDSLPLDAIIQPPPAIAQALGTGHLKQNNDGRNPSAGVSGVFETGGPRKHQW